MFGTTTRLEIDIDEFDAVHPYTVIDFVKRYKCDAIIVPPSRFNDYFQASVIRNSNCKIGIKVDFPGGKKRGTYKLSELPEEAVDASIFEIMVHDKDKTLNYKKELEILKNIIKKSINPTAEVRVVLNTHHRDGETVGGIIEAAKKANYSMVRTNHFTRGTQEIAHRPTVEFIKQATSMPMKLSGNINTGFIKETASMIGKKSRYAVNFEQATEIVKSLKEDARLMEEIQNLFIIEDMDNMKEATLEDIQNIVQNYAEDFVESLGVDRAELSIFQDKSGCKIRIKVLPGAQGMITSDSIPFMINNEVVMVNIDVDATDKMKV